MTVSPKEITVKIRNDEQRYTQKFLEYGDIVLSHDDPKLTECVVQALHNFTGAADEVIISIKMVW